MTDLNRRQALGVLGAIPAAAFAFTWTAEEASAAAAQSNEARAQAAAQQQPYRPRFFTAAEFAAVTALSDTIIPRDGRSGSASEAGAPEFIDTIVAEQTNRQTAMRGGLVWLDSECRRRFDKTFVACTEGERRQVLDDVAWPARARAEFSHGVAFFTTMRDLVATGFWSSRIGVADLGYSGNRPTDWTGAPDAVLRRLGVEY